jgi:hypothetical protein
MTSPFRGVPLRTRAIELMKEGHTADDLHVRFVAEGEDPEAVRGVLTELVALQHQAAAMDPERLRGEAKWMFLRGASVDDVVMHFVRVGVPEEHARPEAERVRAKVQKMRPCQRCGTPTDPEQFFMDLSGFSICNGCNLRDEIGRSEQRGIARDIETIGGFGGFGGALVGSLVADAIAADAHGFHGQTSRPFCAHCKQPTGVHVSQIDPNVRARLQAACEWVCGQCGQKIA